MAPSENLLGRDEIRERHRQLGKAVVERFFLEAEGSENHSRYNMVEDADVVQLANPVPGGAAESWEIAVARYGAEVMLSRLSRPQEGIWWRGETFFFDVGVIIGAVAPAEGLATISDVEGLLLSDDRFFTDLVEALRTWPLAVEFATLP
ncbi:hypothetical protein A3A84_00025 [Candidatus Collierbacteria bacterium RIFCSPLOWO2_01_FULL_50_23]|uniref:Uncharacterized protein n=2 Tax=Candidatus Collieribacteriota TaxID=1752725 RepID=A0A1F5EU53_9BACT|nr:MAG: hypothetical protein A3D09_04070 [Candidatus Collierbacteria bacterium RIFCSPHIGHO2_02_FULL_49_10]OGD71263.1 MAG: hypothetical protein A2703_00860 [Candidatus Collierbacteria bacterium RIFCSPHIGHO2_01_FULL_50_25]OGD74192.1 MAG: hypothetical protein A3A84_00025 [Candidatus Collierbacteria bacterium RIFCSPLOWO2_01_FULL_50_23]